MFGFSVWEIFIILVIALLVIGPERLPGVARTLGSWTYKVKKYVASAKAELDSEFNLQDMKKLLTEQESEISKLRNMVEETRSEVEDSGKYMLGALDEAEKSVTSATAQQTGEVDKEVETVEEEASAAENTRALSLDEEIEEIERESGRKLSRPFASAASESNAESEPDHLPSEPNHKTEHQDERTGRDQQRPE